MKKVVFDPRTQVLLLLIATIAIFISNMTVIVSLFVFMAIYLIIQGQIKSVIKFTIIFTIVGYLQFLIINTGGQAISFLGFFTSLILRFMPIIMAASILSKNPSGKIMSALQKWRLPKNMLVTFVVSLRFLPVMKFECQSIQISAKMRGLSLTNPKNWLHPLNTFEYTIVPLLMRSLRISEELAAAAMTKGIDNDEARTSIYSLKMNVLDYLIIILLISSIVIAGIYSNGGSLW
ncbi:hypothetical protein AZF37_00670 [endosymbiont 'TC1' of Trimyema compressum]|uniref:energy-coupling factor transporter transmembrane component T n=1 Tax=endosymbiont 'TC1' of Trimyema compressum TaxID=243899 RepID=UPI0007F0687C|nr:energy-coupling factor transporter transmembrane component T [endosymbiont 'TC1' of Trimyema compressum]AMP19886.1 hypothetical protein AZF37_00670 [endosymbiont 'TC1' of Trimyema compressum]